MTSPQSIIWLWLGAMAFLVVIMTLLGGIVRLTDSGLSITEWAPILGVIPPLTQADWMDAFAAYRTIPQYEALHAGISLAEFKVIYWWEWAHRFFGRLLGVAFLFPFLFFLWRRWLSSRQIAHYMLIFAAGGLQGFIGWFMVQSGLSDRIDVAPLRLALHLGLAMVIYGWIVLLFLQFWRSWRPSPMRYGLLALIFIQLLLGAMVSGLDGGLIHNHWLWPFGADLTPSLDNRVFWQALHRAIGGLLLVAVLVFAWRDRSYEVLILAFLVCFQLILGIFNLIFWVPLSLALFHQLGAVACWTAALLLLTKSRLSSIDSSQGAPQWRFSL